MFRRRFREREPFGTLRVLHRIAQFFVLRGRRRYRDLRFLAHFYDCRPRNENRDGYRL